MYKKLYFVFISIFIMGCDYTINYEDSIVIIYSGSYGYDVVYRIDGNKIYSGSYGYDVAYRIDR